MSSLSMPPTLLDFDLLTLTDVAKLLHCSKAHVVKPSPGMCSVVALHHRQCSRQCVFHLLAVLLVRNLRDENGHEMDDGFGLLMHGKILAQKKENYMDRDDEY